MKYVFILFISCCSIKAQNCKGFMHGTFEMKYQYGEVMVERSGNWQLEKTEEYQTVSLSKIEKINDCKYLLTLYKQLKLGKLANPSDRVCKPDHSDMIAQKCFLCCA
ncbi:hypothetical protein [Aquimarina sp. Aq78]|uniref:hypothetical protein n=1 Tax=Aquimarina sp. Aq78 TaxID=1191889 RepID=UPI0020C50D6B|nr:hypothetical protein [Aquimarina sp. Aq78]